MGLTFDGPEGIQHTCEHTYDLIGASMSDVFTVPVQVSVRQLKLSTARERLQQSKSLCNNN